MLLSRDGFNFRVNRRNEHECSASHPAIQAQQQHHENRTQPPRAPVMGLLHEMNNYNHTRATRPGARNSDSICSCEHHRRVTHHPPSLIIRRHLVNSPPNVLGSSQPCFTGTTNEKSHFQIPYQSVGWWMVVAGRSLVLGR